MIIIEAYQEYGIKTDEIVASYEFCCWDSLMKQLKGFTLHKCPKCEERMKVLK